MIQSKTGPKNISISLCLHYINNIFTVLLPTGRAVYSLYWNHSGFIKHGAVSKNELTAFSEWWKKRDIQMGFDYY